MMIWIRSLIGARWFPFALLGIPAVVGVVFGWGYLKGSHNAEMAAQERLNKALAIQAEMLKQAHSRQIAALEAKSRREREARRIDDIPRPDIELCDAGGEWLHAVQDAVRMSNGAAGVD